MINKGKKENSVAFNSVTFSITLKELVLVGFPVEELF